MESLQDEERISKRSLGIVSPKFITKVEFDAVKFDDKCRWLEKHDAFLAKGDLPFIVEDKRDIRPVPPPDYNFRVSFRCNDPVCIKDHKFKIMDWEVDALYNNLRKRGDMPQVAAFKVKEKLDSMFAPDKDLHFFLGNISSHPTQFTIVGLWYPKKSETLGIKMPLFR